MDSAFLHGVKKIFHATEDIKELIDPYVTFAFAGQQVNVTPTNLFNRHFSFQVSSKIIYTCSHPDFNQELRLGLKVGFVVDEIFGEMSRCLVSFDVWSTEFNSDGLVSIEYVLSSDEWRLGTDLETNIITT